MSFPLTTAQRAVIGATGHLLVDAGAGSGKTTTVVQAICHQLGLTLPLADGDAPLAAVSHQLKLDQVAAITFTNAAAADLKRKLRHALRSAGRPELAQEVDAARIGTIHGFCGDLMREYALRGGLRPVQRPLNDGEARVLLADCARAALHEAIERGDLPGLQSLLTGRRLKDIAGWIACAAADAGRLERWHATRAASGLRDHEEALLDLARRATALRLMRLEDEGLTDFDHMLGATRELLGKPGVRRAVQRRIRLLVVDEFQDVDPIQRDIAELLGGLAAPDSDPTRLVLVGDPKQSIYRFRRADVALWKGMDARFRSGAGQVLQLTENFRSKAAILGLVDVAIGAMLDSPVDPAAGTQSFEVRYQRLVPTPPRTEGDHAVELQVVPAAPDGKTVTAGVVRELDAAGTAARITELVAQRLYSYGDMAVLLAGWADADTYEQALRAVGIPVYVLRGEGFWDAREVIDCILALRAIRDPADHVAVAGFLKSPFVGVRDDTLLALARARGRGTYVAAAAAAVTDANAPERELLARASGLLTRFAALRDRLPLAALLRRLLLESGYLAASALHADGPQRCANLRKLLRLAAESPGRSLGEFLREVQEARARGDKVAPEPLYRERGDVVTITSIHGAKGLEWPVVFWCDLVREVRTETSRFCEGRDTFALAAVDEAGETGGSDSDPRHAALKAGLTQEGLAEAYRLWYVASTRAKQLLVLGGIPLGAPRSSKAITPAHRLLKQLGDIAGAGTIEYQSGDGTVYHATVRQLAMAAVPTVTQALVEPALALTPPVLRAPVGRARLSASQLMTFAREPARWRRRYVERDAVDAATAAAAARAIATGLVVHDVLEGIDGDATDLMSRLEVAIAEWDEDAPGAETDAGVALREALRMRVEAALASPVWRSLAAAPGARRELWFTRVLPDGTALTGAMDLVTPAGGNGGADGAHILDVKTGGATGATAAERYAVQAAVYVDAVDAITGRAGTTFSLLSLPSGEVTPVPVPADPIPALVRRLRES
jgi:ATP-dependent helicase/nuclease subunit A